MDVRLLWLALGAFAGSVETSIIVGVLPAISSETGVSIAQAGYLVFGYSLAYGIGTPVLSTILSGVDRRTVVASAEFLFGCMAVLFGLLPGFLMLFVARTVLSLGAGLFTSTAQSTAMALAEPGKRGRAVSTVVMGGSLAVAFGAPLAALVAQAYGWRVAYIGLGLVGVTAAAVMWLRLPGDIHGDRRSIRERLSVIGVPGIPMTLLISALGVFAMFLLLTFLAPVSSDFVGLDKGLFPLVLFAFGLGALAGNPLGGYLSDRIGARRTMLLLMGMLVIELGALTLIPLVPQPVILPVYLVYVGLFGLLSWAFFPPQLTRLAALAPASVALSTSLNLTAINVGGALAALCGGFVLDHLGIGYIGLAGALVAAVGLAVTFIAPVRSEAALSAAA